VPQLPSANPRRRNARPNGGVVDLPAGGYAGPIPVFPLAKLGERDSERVEAETTLWAELWRTPQAAAWITMGATVIREVATYCRWQCKGETGDLEATKEARYRADKLGLNPKAMRALLWQVVGDELAQQRTAPRTSSGSARARSLGIAAVDLAVEDPPAPTVDPENPDDRDD
jgi:hypothetical protein